MKSEFMIAITQLAAEKNLPREVILEAMEAALVSAYKKDSDLQGHIVVRIDRETGEHRVFQEQTVVAEIEDDQADISIQDAKKIKPDTTIDDIISEGEKVVVRRTVQGTYKGEVQGSPVPPTGKLVTFTIWEMFRVSNGKIVERWAMHDFRQQLSGG